MCAEHQAFNPFHLLLSCSHRANQAEEDLQKLSHLTAEIHRLKQEHEDLCSHPFNLIVQVGPLPKMGALRMTLMRMREQGFDIRRLIQSALQSGALEPHEAQELSPLPAPGGPSPPTAAYPSPGGAPGCSADAGGVRGGPGHGQLVWAASSVYTFVWPAEMLDPLELPPGRALTLEQMRSLPKSDWRRSEPATCLGSAVFVDV